MRLFFFIYGYVINFIMDEAAQKARPANVLPHKHTNTNAHTISNYIHTYIQLYKLSTTLIIIHNYTTKFTTTAPNYIQTTYIQANTYIYITSQKRKRRRGWRNGVVCIYHKEQCSTGRDCSQKTRSDKS